MNFTKRFNQLIDNQYDGNKKRFSNLNKIPYTTVVEYAKGIKKDPKLSMILKIKNVNTNWLITGKGQMLLDQKTEEEKNTNEELLSLQRFKIKALEKDLANVRSDLEKCRAQLFFKDEPVQRDT